MSEKDHLRDVLDHRRCPWPWSHNWGKWKDIRNGEIAVPADEVVGRKQRVIGYFTTQERRCLSCGKVQLRDETT